ncbi:type II toxin-antitoxin system VapC family toxin [Persicitalea jodogahamensis]|uniref:PIN domain-containing protein n=1 Tax=Persicitalea jodogahamensis TaxID=402147 RepID=A0A8J3D920_9BACT|nr:type II toxin-antitoxin system VapC family toxin [Persicitalea jodogahamensis]GHB68454.1 hypothetical protein GCM10007390_22280 [Persicitalea jodogahamensis]
MRILDSNLIIYSALPEFDYLRSLIKDKDSRASIFSKLEVLGFHGLDSKSKRYFESVFYSLPLFQITDAVLSSAIGLRQQHKMSAGDAVIAATALHYNFELHTRNVEDFKWISGLRIVNPILS